MHLVLVDPEKNINTAMEKNKPIFVGILLCFCLSGLSAQQIKEDRGVKSARSYYEQYYKNKTTLRGYRIQIVTTTDRRKMEASLNKLRNVYPGYVSNWTYTEPYYKVAVGAYINKRTAKEALYHFRKDFPGSILIFSDLRKDELIR